MKNKLPKRVNGWVDRHGRLRYYLRLPGQKGVPLPGPAWSPQMMEAIDSAVREPQTAQRRSILGSYVYFLRYGKRVKIGTATNVQARFKELSTGIPGKARIYYVTPGNRALENELHQLFAADRVSGEWFNWSGAMLEWIAADEERRADERQWISGRNKNVVTFLNRPKRDELQMLEISPTLSKR
jgi:hypothetical protein